MPGIYVTLALALCNLACAYWSEQYTGITYVYPFATHPRWSLRR